MAPPTIAALIDALEGHGAAKAIVAFEKEGAAQWSYGKLAAHISQLSRALSQEVRPGETVALLAGSGVPWIVAALATMRAGAIALPIDVQTDDAGLTHILTDSGAERIFTTAEHLKRLHKLGVARRMKPILLDELAAFVAGQPLLKARVLPQINPEDPAALFYTSGTTGQPKGVPLSHGNLAYQVEAIIQEKVVGPTDRVLLPLPLHHVYPFVIGMLSPLALGLPIVLSQALTGPQIVRAIREGQATIVIGVPRLYRALIVGIESRAAGFGLLAKMLFKIGLATSRFLRKRLHVRAGRWLLRPLHKQLGNSLRVTASGGAQLEPELALDLEALGWQVAIGYGLTETSPLLTINPPGEAHLDSVGHPIDGTEIRIDAVDHQPKQREGEIVARGPGVFSGYLHLAKKTREAFTKDGWFRTGDLGYLDQHNHLHVVGRVSTMIKTEGGEKVQPEDLEDLYAGRGAIREIGILEEQGKLVALVVPEMQAAEPQQQAQEYDLIKQALEARSHELPSHQRISDFALTRDPLPRTQLAKIRRQSMAERYHQAREQPAKGETKADRHPLAVEEMSADDRTLLEDQAANQVWKLLADRFANRRLTPDANLQLELGIDSLEWLNLTLEISQQAGVELEEQVLAGVESVRDLLRAVGESSAGAQGFRPEDLFERPEEFLDDRQRRWLEPLGTLQRRIALSGYALNRLLMRRWFGLQVTGLEHLPPRPPYVITPNHASYLDPLAIAASLPAELLPRVWWTAWTGITFANPLLRLVSRLTHTLPIESERGARASLAFGAAVLRRGDYLVWFPEGGLSRDGRLKPFKPGLGLLLDHFEVPVVPVQIRGSFEAMPAGSHWPHRHQIEVTFAPAIAAAELPRHEGKHPEIRIMNDVRKRVAQIHDSHNPQPA